jgi:hypothetical protein
MALKNQWQDAKNKIAALEGQQKLVNEQLTRHQTQLEGPFSTLRLFPSSTLTVTILYFRKETNSS